MAPTTIQEPSLSCASRACAGLFLYVHVRVLILCLYPRYKFTEFDPNKRLKRGAKKGSAKFKSKSKFKRK